MWKLPFTLFIILTGVISGMLFWQWHAYSKEIEKPSHLVTATQEVAIHTEADSIVVTQKLKGLPKTNDFSFALPNGVSEWSCGLEDGSKCEQENTGTSVQSNSEGNIQIQFSVPVNLNNRAFLLNDWMASFVDIQVTNTKVKLIDSAKRNGTWVLGIPLIGKEKLDLIDYYVFEGELTNPSIFWQGSSMMKTEVDQKLVLYSDQEVNDAHSFASISELEHRSPITVVMTNQIPEENGNGLIITRPDIQPDVLEKKLVYSYMKSKFISLPIEQSWLIDFHVSLFLNKESQISKTNQIVQEILLKLSQEEIDRYRQAFLLENAIVPSKLDKILHSITGRKTDFFDLNKNEDTSFVPLFFKDERNISFQGKIQKDLHMTYLEDQIMFPFVDTLTSLGFEVKVLSDNETLLLTKGLNSYRFYVNQNIFIYNEEDYGLLENPLTKIGDTIYINYQWLTSLFKIEIDEDEHTVYLKEPSQ